MSYTIQHTNTEISNSIDTGLSLYGAGANATTWNAKANKSTELTGTLAVADWSNNAQTLTISGLATSGYSYVVAPISADTEKYTAAKIYADDVTVANTITFHCTTTPTSAIGIKILKIEVA